MDRRKKRTSTNQYMMYIDLMEKDHIFATGRVPRDMDANYLQKKWKELSDKLNSCNSGPTLTCEEWRKRLNDWKNTTRSKYRRSLSGEKDISLTSLEMKALDLFGKTPNTTTETVSIHLKSEKEDPDEDLEHQRTSELFHKELQAAVQEAICGDDEEDQLQDDNEEQEEILSNNVQTAVSDNSSAGVGTATTTYRTIVVENTNFDDDNNDHLEFITDRRHTLGGPVSSVPAAVQTVVSSAVSGTGSTMSKLINGEIPLKRLRSQGPDQVIYEVNTVKKAPISHHVQTQPRTITIHNTQPPLQAQHTESTSSLGPTILSVTGSAPSDVRDIARQLKRIADIKSEKLKFEIARFKFNNPGFQYHAPTL